MNYFLFPIGDWSCDGHSCYADFIVKSEKPLEDVRKAHLKENFFIGSLCSEYQDNRIEIFNLYNFLIQYISEDAAKNKIKHLIDSGIELIDEEFEFRKMESRYSKTAKQNDYKVVLSFDEDEENPKYIVVSEPEQMLEIWLLCLNVIDTNLNLEAASEALSQYSIKYKGYPHKPTGSINFYGFNEENIHLNTPGYGIWDDHCGEFYHDVN